MAGRIADVPGHLRHYAAIMQPRNQGITSRCLASDMHFRRYVTWIWG